MLKEEQRINYEFLTFSGGFLLIELN